MKNEKEKAADAGTSVAGPHAEAIRLTVVFYHRESEKCKMK